MGRELKEEVAPQDIPTEEPFKSEAFLPFPGSHVPGFFRESSNRVLRCEFVDTPFCDVIALLQNVHLCCLTLDPMVWDKCDIEVTLKSDGLKMKTVLDEVLGQVDLVYTWWMCGMLVTTRERLDNAIKVFQTRNAYLNRTLSRKVQTLLQSRVSFEFFDTPLCSAVSDLSKQVDFEIILDATALEADDVPVTAINRDEDIRSALDRITFLVNLDYTIRGGHCVISTVDRIRKLRKGR
jgi:hypothetical protein